MNAIWQNSGSRWELLSAGRFPDERTLHDLVEQSPFLLPLSGRPDLVIIGREVRLGSGYADLLAVEKQGRLALIEIKLSRNAEARRAVVSQVLAYAAYLHGFSAAELQQELGRGDLYDLVARNDQEGATTREGFTQNLDACLRDGRFRLVIVLDSAPAELVALAGYLEAISDRVTVDLIAVSAYDVGSTKLIVPQRIDPARQEPEIAQSSRTDRGQLTEGSEEFERSIEQAEEARRPKLRLLLAWARQLEDHGFVRLSTYKGVLNRWVLLPKLPAEGAGLITLWNEKGPAIQFWRSMFERKAPGLIEPIEAMVGQPIRQGNTIREFKDDLLRLLTEAHRQACQPTTSVPGGV